MKKTLFLLSFIIIFLHLNLNSQDCSVCPPGATVTLDGSEYPSNANFSWSCSNGFTSSLQSPTFAPLESCTCNLIVTQGACVVTDELDIEVCNCDLNTPCINMSFNSSTDCVTIVNTGTTNSPVNTDAKQWRHDNNSYSNYTSALCGCSIYEKLEVTPTCTVSNGNFRLGATFSVCPGECFSKSIFTFPFGSNVSSYNECGAQDFYEISPTDLVAKGSEMTAFYQSNTNVGVVTAKVKYTYNGNGANCNNITTQIIQQGKIYKDIWGKRTVTYTDGCPSDICEIELNIPQVPDECLLDAYVATVTSTSCGGNQKGFNASAYNYTNPVTYQWKYNGTTISGATSNLFCLNGQPYGTYCCNITDAAGCSIEVCKVYQLECSLSVSISESGGILTANLTNCVGGSPSYQWSKWNGSTWVNVGTSQTYNTGGTQGEYKCTVTCGSCTSFGIYSYTPPCTADVTLSAYTYYITASVTGCNGLSINYVWQRYNGGAWTTVQTINTTSTTNNYYPTLSDTYRCTITCGACSDQATISWTAPNPCQNFLADISGTPSLCVGTTYNYGYSVAGGTGPYTQVWKINGVQISTNPTISYTPSSSGTYTLSVTVTDANNCTYTDNQVLYVIVCCSMSLTTSPSNLTVCTNENAVFTATPSGGTSPYTYSWTSQISGGSIIAQGSGNPKTFNFSTAGTYNIVCTVTDAGGCQATDNSLLTVNSCTDCNCSATLTLIGGCILQATFTGTACPGFSYQFQYSPTGTGWNIIQNGTCNNNFQYTPTANGYYRLIIYKNGCQSYETPLVSVNCYTPTCTNPPIVTLNGTIQDVCGTNPVTVLGNTFGGSATQVNLTENGNGSVSPSSVTSSPFSFTYNPTSSDINTTVSITATTNNPLGSPCIPDVKIYGINYKSIPIPVITSSNSDLCVGSSRTLLASPGGGSFSVSGGHGTLVGNVLTATSSGAINITYSLTVNGCTGTATQTINAISCPCQGLTMSVTSSFGSVSFGELKYNGISLNNYRIEWRKCSDNTVVFQSGMGTGSGSGIYSHPSSNVPIEGGCYYAYIVTSDQGNGLDCFPDINVSNWSCSNPPSYSYNGPGGSASTRTFLMDINSNTSYIKIGLFADYTVPDLLEVIYNNNVIFASYGDLENEFIPISYISGQTYVKFRITNSDQNSNTIWTLQGVSCCNGLDPCPILSNVPIITSAVLSYSSTCAAIFNFNYNTSWPSHACRDCVNHNDQQAIGGCYYTSYTLNTNCYDDNITVTKPQSGASRRLDFNDLNAYNAVKAGIQAVSGSTDFIIINLRNQSCGNDALLYQVKFFPFHCNITYNDLTKIIDIIPQATNPFANSCTNCTKASYTKYQNMLTDFNTSINSVYLSVQQIFKLQLFYNSVTDKYFNHSITCSPPPCSVNLERKYWLHFRSTACPVESYQLFYDNNNDGTYETLINQASGWSGTCP